MSANIYRLRGAPGWIRTTGLSLRRQTPYVLFRSDNIVRFHNGLSKIAVRQGLQYILRNVTIIHE